MPRPQLGPLKDKSFYEKEYLEMGRSPKSIAEELGTYTNRIYRDLKYYDIKLRTPSDAQKLALANGSRLHPTQGKSRTETEKQSISLSMKSSWQTAPQEERTRRKETAKRQWQNRDPEKAQKFKENCVKAIKETTKDGSKLERFLARALQTFGLELLCHSEVMMPGETMHVDIQIPAHRIAIEVDGPAHYNPDLYGVERFERRQAADLKKNMLLTNFGFHVIRIKYLDKFLAEHRKQSILKDLLSIVEEIKNNSIEPKVWQI